MWGEAGDVAALKMLDPALRSVEAGQAVELARPAGAVGADDHVDLARFDLQRDGLERLGAAKTWSQRVCLGGRRGFVARGGRAT